MTCSADHRDAVRAEFRKQLARDRVKTMSGGFSQLGLVEMTRKRSRKFLAPLLCEPCPGEGEPPRFVRNSQPQRRKTWACIRESATRLPPPALMHQDLNLLQRVLRDLVSDETQTIRIDLREQFGLLRAFGEEFMPSAVAKLALYKGERPIFDLYSVDEEIFKAVGRRVDLKSAGGARRRLRAGPRRLQPMSIKADCIPGSTRATLPR